MSEKELMAGFSDEVLELIAQERIKAVVSFWREYTSLLQPAFSIDEKSARIFLRYILRKGW